MECTCLCRSSDGRPVPGGFRVPVPRRCHPLGARTLPFPVITQSAEEPAKPNLTLTLPKSWRRNQKEILSAVLATRFHIGDNYWVTAQVALCPPWEGTGNRDSPSRPERAVGVSAPSPNIRCIQPYVRTFAQHDFSVLAGFTQKKIIKHCHAVARSMDVNTERCMSNHGWQWSPSKA